MQYPIEAKRKFANLRAKGYTYPEISKEIGISERTAQTWNKDLAEEINTARTEYIGEILQEYISTKRKRLDSLQSVVNSMNAALESLDYSRMPPEKLLKLKLEYEETINKEFIGIIGNEAARDRAYTDRTEAETKLATAKVDKIKSEQSAEELYQQAIDAFRSYNRHSDDREVMEAKK